MALLSGLFNIAQRFLGRGPRKDTLDRLPNEVLLDILSLLDVVDIIHLRRVSKLYHQLTQDAALWKRLLRRADIPLPMLPPTSQHTIDRMCGLEAERLLIRAHSIARNWKSSNPKVLREWAFDTSYYRVLEMAVLPGGNHLVTAVSDKNEQRYSLIVWDMDVKGKPKMVAAVATDTKAYEIQAKYMTIDGEKTIALAYLQRDYLRKEDRIAAALGRIQSAGQLSTYHKLDAEFRYQCIVDHLPLENLQRYVDIPYPYDTPQYRAEMEKLPKAFIRVAAISSRSLLSCPVLGELFGAPHLAIVKGTSDIVFKKLGGKPCEAATLTCMDLPNFAQTPHAIKGIRLLPQEHSVFVLREVDTPRPAHSRRPTYLFEIYSALRCGQKQKNQHHYPQYHIVEDTGKLGDLAHIYVPEFPPYVRPKDLTGDKPSSAKSSFDPSAAAPEPPPPICIYAHRSGNPEGILRIVFHPRRIVSHLPPSPITPTVHAHAHAGTGAPGGIFAPTQITYRHTLESNRMVFQSVSDPNDVIRIIPAATRPLFCLSIWDDHSAAPLIGQVRPFVDRGWEARPRLVDDVVLHPQPDSVVDSLHFGSHKGEHGGGGLSELEKRVAAFAWEESIGRLIIAEEGTNQLSVYDFAATPGPLQGATDMHRWKRPQDYPMPDLDVLMNTATAPAAAQSGHGRMQLSRHRYRTGASRSSAAASSSSGGASSSRTATSSRRGGRGSSATASR